MTGLLTISACKTAFNRSLCALLAVHAVFLPVSAQMGPPGLVRTVEVEAAQALIFPIPFEPDEPDLQQVFTGQIEPTGLIVNQWNAAAQVWSTATYTPGIGWAGDTITLTAPTALSVQLPPGQANIKLSFGGMLGFNSLTQTLYPGLNHVMSPEFSDQPLTVWTWDVQGNAGASLAASDVLYDSLNQQQAWLQAGGGGNSWTGVVDPLLPGTLLPDQVYFYEYKGVDPIIVQEAIVASYVMQPPYISAVTYNPVQDQVEVSVYTDSLPHATTEVDLFYQDVEFPAGIGASTSWKVWEFNEAIDPTPTTVFIDSGNLERVHPRTVAVRKYQVGLSVDTDGDGLSDPYEALVTQTLFDNPDTDGDGVPDGVEVTLGMDPNTADPAVSAVDLIVDVLDANEQDSTGRLTTTLTGGAVGSAEAGGIVGNTFALELDGGSQQLNFGSHADFNTGGPYITRTFSLWFAVEELQGKQLLFESGGYGRGFNAYLDGTTLYIGAWDAELDAGDQTTWAGGWLTSNAVSVNTWHHLVLVLDASADPTQVHAGALRAYLDGAEIGTGLPGMRVFQHADGAALGGVNGSTLLQDGTTTGTFNLTGVVDAFQVWNRALTPAEVALLYYPAVHAASTTTWYPSPMCHFRFEGDYTDAQGNMNLTVGGSSALQNTGVIGSGSVHAAGDANLSIQHYGPYNDGTFYKHRTVSLWFTTDHFDFGRQMIYEIGNETRGMNLYIDDGVLYAGGWDRNKDGLDIQKWNGSFQHTSRLQPNQWHHVALVLDASADPARLNPGVFIAYLDGVAFEQGSTEGMQIRQLTGSGGILSNFAGTRVHDLGDSSAPMKLYGGMDDVRVWNRSLKPDTINALYQEGVSNGVTPGWDVDSFYQSYNLVGGLDDDPDGDGYTNAYEIRNQMDPNDADYHPYVQPRLMRAVWWGIGGSPVSNLTNHSDYPWSPDLVTEMPVLFESPVNIGNSYGQRIAGSFRPPRDGTYIFHINGDDQCELWLTTPVSGRQLLATVPEWTGQGEWDKFPQQQSVAVQLEAGQAYLLEALMKEHGGNDHLQVGITFPAELVTPGGTRAELPVRSKWFEKPPADISFTQDTDGDGLSDYEEWVIGTDPLKADTDGDRMPDGFEVDSGFDPLDPADGLVDADGDGLNTYEEYRAGTDAGEFNPGAGSSFQIHTPLETP